jgi:hypothetical protein
MGERHNSGFKKLVDFHLTSFFCCFWLGYFTLKVAKKWENFHQRFETTGKKKKHTTVGLYTVDDLVDKIANELLFSTYLCCCPLGILNYIVVNDNNIIMYWNLPIQFTGPIRLILWASGGPPTHF